MRVPIKTLSGGEKARLILARLMAKESNLLILDEPTNDFDIETLDLLQDILADYEGTVLMVSHDRDFLDRVATSTIVLEGNGSVNVYAGGWTDYQLQKPQVQEVTLPKLNHVNKKIKIKKKLDSVPLTFTEKHRLKLLPNQIQNLEKDIKRLELILGQSDLFNTQPAKFKKATELLIDCQKKLVSAELEWLELEEKETN